MEEPASIRQIQLIEKFVAQGKLNITDYGNNTTKQEADRLIKLCINGNGKEYIEEGTKFTGDINKPFQIKREMVISNDQLARTYSNIFSVIYNKEKSIKSILKRTDEVYKHFKEVI